MSVYAPTTIPLTPENLCAENTKVVAVECGWAEANAYSVQATERFIEDQRLSPQSRRLKDLLVHLREKHPDFTCDLEPKTRGLSPLASFPVPDAQESYGGGAEGFSTWEVSGHIIAYDTAGYWYIFLVGAELPTVEDFHYTDNAPLTY